MLYVGSSGSAGSRGLRLKKKGDTTTVEEVWTSRKIKVSHGNWLRIGDYVYGSGGGGGGGSTFITAFNIKTGEIAWQERGFGQAKLIRVGKNVLILDPDTGTQIEMLLPELEIEIFPIDDDAKDGSDGKGKGANFRFQLQPKIEGTKRHLYLRMQWLGTGQEAVRTLELDLGTDLRTKLDIEQLLNSEPLKKELEQLPPEFRKQLESMLRQAQMPAPKVRR